MATLQQFKDFTSLALVLSALWEENLVEEAAVAPMFNVLNSTNAEERRKGLGKLGLVPEYNGTIEYDEFDPLDMSTYTHTEYARGIKIARSLLDDGQYGIIQTMVTENARGFNRTVAYQMASVFNNAFNSNFTGPDGKALCATGRNSGKAVLNNKGTSALTHDSVKTTKHAMRSFKDANGLKLLVQPDTLIVPTDLEDAADEIVNSVNRSDNANNAINSNRRMGYIVEPLLDDTNNWFMADSVLARDYLVWFWRVMPEFLEDPKSDYDLEMRMRGYMRQSYGWDTHVWLYGHEVANS